MARTGQPATREVASVQRAVAILGELAEARAELGTNEIARRTGINVSTISRILATLVSGGLVEHVAATGRYRLGLGVVRLANAVHGRLDIRSLAQPQLAELASRTRETATVSVPGEHEAITLDFVQSPLSVRSVAEVGRTSAAHATAVGKVFLAYGGTLPAEGLATSPRPGLHGADTLETSVQMAEMAIADGVTHIVGTPHANSKYKFDPELIRQRRDELQAAVGDRLILATGCDFHLSFENLQDIQKNPHKYTINQKNYLLVEFADFAIPPFMDDTMHQLQLMGLSPIITHPERNALLRTKPERCTAGCIRAPMCRSPRNPFLGVSEPLRNSAPSNGWTRTASTSSPATRII